MMTAITSDVRLSLPARAENVAVVRHMLGAFGDPLGFGERTMEDIRLAVTEACTNVVRHAYDGEDGLMDVSVRPTGEGLEIEIADHGRGMGPSADASGPGFGLPMMAALADGLEVDNAPGRGSRVTMAFHAPVA